MPRTNLLVFNSIYCDFKDEQGKWPLLVLNLEKYKITEESEMKASFLLKIACILILFNSKFYLFFFIWRGQEMGQA